MQDLFKSIRDPSQACQTTQIQGFGLGNGVRESTPTISTHMAGKVALSGAAYSRRIATDIRMAARFQRALQLAVHLERWQGPHLCGTGKLRAYVDRPHLPRRHRKSGRLRDFPRHHADCAVFLRR